MGDVIDDVGGFLEDAADVVVDVVGTVTDPVSSVVETVVSPIAEAVSSIPVVGDVVEMAAPFAGILGTVVGGPLGGAIGGALGNAFDGEGGTFDFLDTAIGVFGGDLPGPLADIAGNLLDGGSLIDTATSVFGGDLGGMAQNLLGGELGGLLDGDLGQMAQNILGGNMPDIGDLAGQVLGGEGGPLSDLGGFGDIAENILGGNMPDLGDLGGIAGQVLGDNMPDLGPLNGIVGQVLGGDGVPDLSDIGGLGGLIKTADSVFGGLGLGNLESAAQGILGEAMPDAGGDGGWFGSISPLIPDQLDFGGGCWSPPLDITSVLGSSGGSWLDAIAQQAESVAQSIPGGGGGMWGNIVNDIEQAVQQIEQAVPTIIDTTELVQAAQDATGSDLSDTGLDDLVFNLPGVDGEGAARDALQQLVDNGNLGEALASLSQNDLTSLVTQLVAPTVSPTIGTIVGDAATSGQSIDDLGLPSFVTDDVAPQAADDFGDDLVTAGTDDGLGGTDAAGGLGDDAMADSAATSGLADAGQDAQIGGQDDFDDGLGLEGLGSDGGGGVAEPEPAMETFTPEPEPESDFSQQIAEADAVDDSFDSMFDDLGGQGQG